MDLNWLETLIYGLVCGLSEFLPVSAQAHRVIMQRILGSGVDNPLMNVAVRIAVLAALLVNCGSLMEQMRRERRLTKIPMRRRKRQPDMQRVLDLRLVQTAAVPILLSFLLYQAASSWVSDLSRIAIFLVLNGVILFAPTLVPTANKDSRSMSRLDSLLIGIAGALGVIPGISRVGATLSAAVARGADKQNALNWSLLLSIPALICLVLLDAYAVAGQGIGTIDVLLILQCVLGAAAAYVGANLGMTVMRHLAVRLGFSGFAYYSWGAALFTFILYLITT